MFEVYYLWLYISQSDGQIILTTPDQTYQLGLSDISEQDKFRKCLASIGHDDDLTLVEENVLMQGYLDKKGPSYAIATKKWVTFHIATLGKWALSWFADAAPIGADRHLLGATADRRRLKIK